MASRRKFVAGNWKMNGSLAANGELLGGLLSQLAGFDGADVAVCAPALYLAQVGELVKGSKIAVGAQNASEYASGAYTGEVSCAMLKEFGVRYVIVGHSERRALFGESNAQVAAKFAAVLIGGLVPILCVGETLAEREAGATESVVAGQLDAVLALGADKLGAGVVAYEPVWAIGTGKVATNEQAQEVHASIRQRLAGVGAELGQKTAILYGGSVKPENAAEIMAGPDVDGALVGGASLVADSFLKIVKGAIL